jgi:hypothetical protein
VVVSKRRKKPKRKPVPPAKSKVRVVRPVTQGEAIAKWKADNERLGVGYMNEAYDRLNTERGIVIDPHASVPRRYAW